MNNYKVLKDNSVVNGDYSIVPIRFEDRLSIMKWRNEQIYHLRQSRVLKEQDQTNYFNEVVFKLFEEEFPQQILFSYLEKGKCIGYGGLVHINWIDRNAEISFIMDTQLENDFFDFHWAMYLYLLEKIAFLELKLYKIYTYAFDLRPHLYTTLELNGYINEARLKEHCFFQGVYKDVVIHAKNRINYLDHIINVRLMGAQDLDTVFELSNEALTRAQSFNIDRIGYDSHVHWFKKKVSDPNGLYLMVECFDIPQAIVRFDIGEENTIVGINLNKNIRGKGMATKILSKAIVRYFEQYSNPIIAYIKESNTASIKTFQKVGFQKVEALTIKNSKAVKFVFENDG